jgi:uncharacterized protein involved in outer membrane biogenesis
VRALRLRGILTLELCSIRNTVAIRRSIVVVLIVSAIALTGAVAALTFTDPDRYRPEVIAYLHNKTGKQIQIGRLGVSLLPTLSIRLYDFGVKNPTPFPPKYFLSAPTVTAEIDAAALLHRQIVIKSVVLDDPVINVISDPDGLWNFENAAASKSSGQSDREPPPFSLGVISRVEIKGGTLSGSSLIDPSDRPGPIVLEVHNIAAQLKQVDFDAFTRPASSLVAEGDLKADSARFGSVPTTNLRAHLRILPKQVFLSNLSVEAHGGRASGDFSFNLAGSKTKFSTNVQASGVDVAYLLAQFPGGRGKMTGKMQGNLKLEGEIEHSYNPLEGIRGSSHIIVRDGELPTLNQNKNMIKMTRFRDPGAASLTPSSFSRFSADMNLANRRMSSHLIDISFYGIEVQCSGSLGVAGGGGLDYKGVATVLKSQGFFTNTMARMSGAKLEKGKLSFPIRIEGTLQNPKFSAGN